MILIHDIKYYEVEGDIAEIYYRRPHEFMRVGSDEGSVVADVDDLRELVEGRRFCRPSDGTDIVVGLSREAQDLLGLQYEAWENIQAAYQGEQRSNSRLRDEVEGWRLTFQELENATVWRRLVWLFKGIY